MKQSLIVLAIIASASAFCQSKDLIMIKVIEADKLCKQPSLIMVTDNSNQEIIELNSYKSGHYLSDEAPNQKLIHGEILNVLNKGFVLLSHTSDNQNVNSCSVQIQTILFIKD